MIDAESLQGAAPRLTRPTDSTGQLIVTNTAVGAHCCVYLPTAGLAAVLSKGWLTRVIPVLLQPKHQPPVSSATLKGADAQPLWGMTGWASASLPECTTHPSGGYATQPGNVQYNKCRIIRASI